MKSNARSRARATARACSRRLAAALPTIVLTMAIVAVASVAAHAQGVSSTPIEVVAQHWRDWMITKIVPFGGAAVLSWNALETKTGHREGFSKLTKGFLALVAGLASAGIVSSASSLVN